MDCGPTCLRMVAKHYGRNITLDDLHKKSQKKIENKLNKTTEILYYHLIKTFIKAKMAPNCVAQKTKAQRIIWNLASVIFDSTKSFVAVLLNSLLVSSRKILISFVTICCFSSTILPTSSFTNKTNCSASFSPSFGFKRLNNCTSDIFSGCAMPQRYKKL